MVNRPFIWQMVKEAVENLGGKTTYREIRNYIKEKYGDVNENTINAQIIVLTVNQPSRVHYPENRKPRTSDSRYDVLFRVGRGEVELYDPEKHGKWEMVKDEFDKLVVREIEDDIEVTPPEDELGLEFPFESHLRDFISQNLESIEVDGHKLMLYVDEEGNDGVEYPTGVGYIDILAVDEDENFIVFELKLIRGMDKALGQILRYMGWIKENIASGKEVKGVIVSKKAEDKLKYAASIVPNIKLFEYELEFKINKVEL